MLFRRFKFAKSEFLVQIVMPRLGWRWLLALSSIPSFVIAIISFFAPESPRYLFTEGRTNEAMDILKKVAWINRKELPTGFLLSDQRNPDEEISPSGALLSSTRKKMGGLQSFTKIMLKLFSPDLLRTTLLLLLLHFGYTFAFYGIVLMISALNSNQSSCSSLSVTSKAAQDTSLYRSVLITCSAGNN